MKVLRIVSVLAALLMVLGTVSGVASADRGREQTPAEYWTAARVASAIPRDLVIDHRGLGYLKLPSGDLQPYGHGVAAEARGLHSIPLPMAKPAPGAGGGGSDTVGPTVTDMSPVGGTTIGVSQQFSAAVNDSSGVRSVTFYVQKQGGLVYSFAGTSSGGVTWAVSLEGFTDGNWEWWIVAKDTVKRGGNSTTTPAISFEVDTGGPTPQPPPPDGDIVAEDRWLSGGTIQTASGRLIYEMPANRRQTRWNAYVCSGTVVYDGAGVSLVLTAAHCVYDDANKAFARNVIFIPNQDHGTDGTDWNCGNDPYGCWSASAGVVDRNWTFETFPANVKWDYAYYVLKDSDHSSGAASLAATVGSIPQSFTSFTEGADTQAMGYSYDHDPWFMYCKESVEVRDGANYWMPNCDLTGGSSGGPWLQPIDVNAGPIISVNSWGYTTSPGMAGPKLAGTSASLVFDLAKTATGDKCYGGSCR